MPESHLSEPTVSRVTEFWASHLGVPTGALFSEPLHIVTHGRELADYCGIFALFRGGKATVSIPPDREESLHPKLATVPFTSPAAFAGALRILGTAVIGPAYIGYADTVVPPEHPVRPLTPVDANAVDTLKAACDATEWEHGGCTLGQGTSSGVFVGDLLVALAGYEIWGGVIAHISVITQPGFRGRRCGRSAVAGLAAQALTSGLIPQYRTLESNLPSMGIADALGFRQYATSVAVRLKPSVV